MNAADPVIPTDIRIPNQIILSSDRVTLAMAMQLIDKEGLALWDLGIFSPVYTKMLGFLMNVSQAGLIALAANGGGGAGGKYAQAMNGGPQATAGNNGSAGINGCCGGGASGGSRAGDGYDSYSAGGRPGSIFCGGGGGGGSTCATNTFLSTPAQLDPNLVAYCKGMDASVASSSYSAAGGAGSPPGNGMTGAPNGTEGVGGRLMIICYGTITVQSGGKIEANGMPGGNGGQASGGGSGGGVVTIITPTSAQLVNSGTIQASGGAGGASGTTAGNGGAGSVVTKTFTQMGW